MNEWREVRLADLCDEVQYGVTAKASAEGIDGPLLLRVTDIVPPRIDWKSVPHCDLDEDKADRFELHTGDIVVARTGSVGYAKYIRNPPRRAVFASYLVRFRVGDSADPAYVGHVVESQEFKQYVLAQAGGSAQPNANAKVLGSFSVSIPGKLLQGRISAVLSAFNELIEVNERRIEVLEDLARSLYREWFVHFRFPGHEKVKMVDSESGSRPEKWEIRKLGEVAEVNAQSFKLADLPDPFEYLDISAVGVGRINRGPSVVASDAPGRARRKVQDGDTVWATVRPNRRAHGLVHNPSADLVVSTGLAVLTPQLVPSSFLFEYSSRPEFGDYLVGRATGSAYPAVRPSDFEDAPILVPSGEVLGEFEAHVDQALRLSSHLRETNLELEITRDLLLPRLVTGKLDISDIDLGVLTPSESA